MVHKWHCRKEHFVGFRRLLDSSVSAVQSPRSQSDESVELNACVLLETVNHIASFFHQRSKT